MKTTTITEDINFIKNMNIYLTQEPLLNASDVFMHSHEVSYEQTMKMFLYILAKIDNTTAQDSTSITIGAHQYTAIVGTQKRTFTFKYMVESIDKFVDFLNSDNIKKELHSTSEFITKYTTNSSNKEITLEVNNNNNVIQDLIHKPSSVQGKFVMFKFYKVNVPSQSKYYLYFFLIMAGLNKINHLHYKVPNIIAKMGLSQKTKITRIREILNVCKEPLLLSFSNLRITYTKKKGNREAIIAINWTKYNSGLNTSANTRIVEGGLSYISTTDVHNEIFTSWDPDEVADEHEYLRKVTKHIKNFEIKYNTVLENYLTITIILLSMYRNDENHEQENVSSNIFNNQHSFTHKTNPLFKTEDEMLLEALNNNNTNENGDIF